MLGAPPSDRTRVLSNDEIHFVMATESPAGPLLRFLLLTGLRIGEAYNGHREGQYWVVPINASKNQREHRVWLSDLAVVQLEQHPWAARRSLSPAQDPLRSAAADVTQDPLQLSSLTPAGALH